MAGFDSPSSSTRSFNPKGDHRKSGSLSSNRSHVGKFGWQGEGVEEVGMEDEETKKKKHNSTIAWLKKDDDDSARLHPVFIRYDADSKLNRFRFPDPDDGWNPHSLVVTLGAVCRDGRAAYGVSFGPDSAYNTSALLDADLEQTQFRAEIEGLAKAIQRVKEMMSMTGGKDGRAADITALVIWYGPEERPELVGVPVQGVRHPDDLCEAFMMRNEGRVGKDGVWVRKRYRRPFAYEEEVVRVCDELYGISGEGKLETTFWSVERREIREAIDLALEALKE